LHSTLYFTPLNLLKIPGVLQRVGWERSVRGPTDALAEDIDKEPWVSVATGKKGSASLSVTIDFDLMQDPAFARGYVPGLCESANKDKRLLRWPVPPIFRIGDCCNPLSMLTDSYGDEIAGLWTLMLGMWVEGAGWRNVRPVVLWNLGLSREDRILS
jgi:hypothetical protein